MMSPQLDPVAELETLKTHVDHSGTGSTRKENEHHEEHSHHKKSLFSKVKDKAKKLQHSLSGKRRHDEEGGDATTMSPPFGRSEDHHVREAGGYATLSPRDKSKYHKEREEGEVDPEYLGAPMYESNKAPEELKETARQHPRETPVITETNVLSVLPPSHNAEQEHKDCTGSKAISPSKTVTETVTETLAPAYAKVSEATHAITKKIQDMAFPESTEAERKANDVSEINTTAGTNQPAGFNTKVWDKGVSMKEYISQKFEPGEDDRALSQVITKAISPRKASSEASTFGGATNKGPLLANNTNEIVEVENHGKMLQPN